MDFDDKAKNWDTQDRALRAVAIAGELELAIAGETYHKALEFGCGTGLVSFNLQHLLREITLVDSSAEMIRVLKNKIRDSRIHNMAAYTLDIVKGEPLPGRYDLIYMSMALHHIFDTGNLLRTLSANMDPDGLICIVDLLEMENDFHKSEPDFVGHNGFNPEHLQILLEGAGFIDIEYKTIYEGVKKTDEGEFPYSLFLMTAKKEE